MGDTSLRNHPLRHALLGLCLLGLVAIQPAHAQGRVTLNLKNADINALIASISEITGKNFIVDPRVRARVSVISAKPMEEEEVYEVFLSILAVHGFAAIPGDNIIKIVPEVNAKQDNIPTVDQYRDDPDDQMVTRVIQVQNVSAAQIVPILRPLIPPQGHLAAYTPTNVLIVSDRAGNAARIANIISRVDLASTEEVEIVPLRHASATDVVRVLTALEQGRGQTDPAATTSPPRLVADERTNSILMTGDPAASLRLRTLITHLDTPLVAVGNTQVIYLRYAKATELVPVLQGVSRQLTQDQQNPSQLQPQQQQQPQQQRQPLQQQQARADGTLDIQADEATNSLVVTGPPDSIHALRSVIAQLDIRRAQVLVEAAIVEIASDKVAELGIQWVVDGSDSGVVGFTHFPGAGPASLGSVAAAINAGQIPGIVPEGLLVGAGDLSSRVRFGALISALARDADTNVLSTPTLVTLDNEEAEIVVAQNVPFVTGQFITTTGDSIENPFQTIQRQDVGLILTVRPQINEGDAVRLEISQEVSSLAPGITGAADLITNRRSIRTSVLVEDGQVLVLGGLMDDNLNERMQKVPGLGDLPLVGNLFRFRAASSTKRNLMVFLHPIILRDATQGTLHTNDKYSHIRNQQLDARQRGVGMLPDAEAPLLAPPEQVQERKSLLNIPSEPPPPTPAPSTPQPQAPAPAPAPVRNPTPYFDDRFNSK